MDLIGPGDTNRVPIYKYKSRGLPQLFTEHMMTYKDAIPNTRRMENTMDYWMDLTAENENTTEPQNVGITCNNPGNLYYDWKDTHNFLPVHAATALASINEKATEKQCVGTTQAGNSYISKSVGLTTQK